MDDAMPDALTATLIDTPTFDAGAPGAGRSMCSASRQSRKPHDCGDIPFVIKRDGTWLYRGSPIGRREMVCLFSSVLKRELDGSYWLETPVERGRIVVEDVPWLAVEMDWCGCGQDQVLSFRTNVDQVVAAGAEHPIRVRTDDVTGEPVPYILVRQGQGGPPLEARISRAVYYELAALSVPCCCGGRDVMGVWSQNRFFILGDMPACSDCDPPDCTGDD